MLYIEQFIISLYLILSVIQRNFQVGVSLGSACSVAKGKGRVKGRIT